LATHTIVPPTPTAVPPTATLGVPTATATTSPWVSIDIAEGTIEEQIAGLFGVLDEHGYGHLIAQIQQLPVLLGSATPDCLDALRNVTALLAGASDPRLLDALDLMAIGGRGSDLVSYGPGWNTQLEILCWLGIDNRFKVNDVLPVAIAMGNGLWAAMGDEEVRTLVRSKVDRLLKFHRANNPSVEDFPLEALLALAWEGNYSVWEGREPNHLPNIYRSQGFGPLVYRWNTPVDLAPYREWVERKGLVSRSPARTVRALETWLYFSGEHWEYAGGNEMLDVWGTSHVNHDIGSPDFTFSQLQKGSAKGDCGDETAVAIALLASVGIPSLPAAMQAESVSRSHVFPMYYDHTTESWKSSKEHAYMLSGTGIDHFHFYVTRPPVMFPGYLSYGKFSEDGGFWDGGMAHRQYLELNEIQALLVDGIPTSRVSEWLLR
jgi:hypothetical protein